jgi:phage-related holin
MTGWQLVWSYLSGHPAIIPLLMLMAVNLVYQGARHFMGRAQVGDPGLLDFIWRKFSELLIVLISAIVETLIDDLPLVDVVALFYCAVEVLEMLKTAIKDGLEVPHAFEGAVTVLMGGQRKIEPKLDEGEQ